MTILEELAEAAKMRVEEDKKAIPLAVIRREALSMPSQAFRFEKALRQNDIAFITECKKASPSRGLIAPDFPYISIAQDYEAAGAAAVSVLTEPTRFLGSDRYLETIAQTVTIPCLRKDFTVDEYMLYQARALGASAVLLIVSLLTTAQLREYIEICDTMGLSALVEIHDANEAEIALAAGARVVGVNNRNLKDFSVNTNNSAKLRSLIPPSVIFVAESGVKTAEDITRLREISVNAVLIGETLMRAADKRTALAALRGTAV